MRFHVPSFVLGAVAGASGATLAPRLRPAALELATACYRAFDATVDALDAYAAVFGRFRGHRLFSPAQW